MNFDDFDKLRRFTEPFSKFAALAKAMNPLPSHARSILDAAQRQQDIFDRLMPYKKSVFYDAQKKLDYLSKIGETLSVFDRLSRLHDGVNNNPEIQFISVSELELLSLTSTEELTDSIDNDEPDSLIDSKEKIVERNLLPYLEQLDLDYLWLGANHVLNDANNPDRFRHALISLRTLLEYLIDGVLTPNEFLEKDERFKKDFKNYYSGKTPLEKIKIPRHKRIEYLSSKIEFGILEQLTAQDINFICECYAGLCDVHNPKITLSENQVRILKVKTGITLWLLTYVNEALNVTGNKSAEVTSI
jgi:hypothetical protein